MIEIIEYTDVHAPEFREMNLDWLNKYNLAEEADLIILDNPRSTILDTGGAIYLARTGDKIIGSAALINEHEGVFELAKMAVIPAWQGKGISKLLIDKCLEKAKALGAKKIILYSNSQLKAAIGLYAKYGFKNIEVTDSPFVTADVKMELDLF